MRCGITHLGDLDTILHNCLHYILDVVLLKPRHNIHQGIGLQTHFGKFNLLIVHARHGIRETLHVLLHGLGNCRYQWGEATNLEGQVVALGIDFLGSLARLPVN